MKIAVIQDQLLTPAGSERVFLNICEAFPSADKYTFCYNMDTTLSEFKSLKLILHPLGRFVKSHSAFKLVFPILGLMATRWNFSNYDLIITSSATIAKYVNKGSAIHICYCYTPTRALWFSRDYFGTSFFSKLFLLSFGLIFDYLRYCDLKAAKRVDYFIAISKITQDRILQIYKRSSTIIYSPVDTKKFCPGAHQRKENYFLLVSRLERWKRLDYVVDAFNLLGLPLLVVGTGPERDYLSSIAKDNIRFMGAVDDDTLVNFYRMSKAVVFPTDLEYGLVPLEANACGTPVIALARGGVLETMIWDSSDNNATAVLFENPDVEELVKAVHHFNSKQFRLDTLVDNANLFDTTYFKSKLVEFVSSRDDLHSSV